MDRINGAGHVAHMFVAEDVPTNRPPTECTAEWLNMIQEELAKFPESIGKALDPNNRHQVFDTVLALIEARSGNYALDTGAANAYVIALSPAIAAYTGNFSGSFKAVNANTGAATLNAGGGVIPLVNDVGGALAPGDIQAASIVSYNFVAADNKAYMTSVVASQVAAKGTNADITSLNSLISINGNQIGGYHNRIINSGFPISRVNGNSAVTITAAAALQYVVDQFYAYCTGANVTGQRVAGAAQDQYKYQLTGAASVTAIGFAQRMEASRTYSLNGGNATLSVELANSLLTTVTWTAYYANTADTFGTLATPTKTQIATGTFTVNGTLNTYSAQIAIPAAATTGIEIVLSVGAQTSGTWTVGEFQLVPGSIAEAFEEAFYDDQLRWCKRFMPELSTNSLASAYVSVAGTGATAVFGFDVTARVAPTGIFTASIGGTLYIGNTSNAITGIVANIASTTTASITVSVAGGLTLGQAGLILSGATIFLTGAQL